MNSCSEREIREEEANMTAISPGFLPIPSNMQRGAKFTVWPLQDNRKTVRMNRTVALLVGYLDF